MENKENGLEILIELANQILDKDLREKVISILKDPKLKNPLFKYEPLKIEESPAGYKGFEHHMYKGGLLLHTISVTTLSINIAQTIMTYYPILINLDYLIAGALLHDLMRIYDFKKKGKTKYELTPKLLDHASLISCELYARGFPEEVVHIVISHLGQGSPIPPSTIEAIIVHFADTIDAQIDFLITGKLKEDEKE